MAIQGIRTKVHKLDFEQKIFIRDGRAPVPKSAVTSKVMSANKAKDTKPEILFRKALWAANIKGYRLHWRKAPGKPDIAFPSQKVAIFINGCFWHRCPNCDLSIPKSNALFWKQKFDKNIERDSKKIELLKEANWKVVIIWECEIKADLVGSIKKIKDLSKKLK